MIKIMERDANYYKMQEKTRRKTILYGAGAWGKRVLPYLKDVAFICDQRADDIKEIKGIHVISMTELCEIKEPVLIVVCVKSTQARNEIIAELKKSDLDAMVFDFFENETFDHYEEKDPYKCGRKKLEYINIICDDQGWILRKFALKLCSELEKQGYRCSIATCVNPKADMNHHVTYSTCNSVAAINETFMITHIDSYNKIEKLKYNLKNAMMGICMSRETMEKLTAYGIPREKLCYINPAQDGVIEPKKYVLGITSKTHVDHRKSEYALIDICKAISPVYFTFKIMGSGWEDIVEETRGMGFEIEYYNEFDYDKYTKLMPSLDYYLYWGFDEGSMGYLDALRAGIGTIVTPQGYHLDVKDGIKYACRTIPDFVDTLLELQSAREKTVRSVEEWTWRNFADKHIEVWNYLLGNEENIYRNQHRYEDGIFSVMRYNA